MVKDMGAKGDTLVIQSGSTTYTIPASDIDIDAVSAQLGQSVSLADITVQVGISEPSDGTAQVVADAANAGGFTIVVPAVEFTITCSYNGQSVEVSSFNSDVENDRHSCWR